MGPTELTPELLQSTELISPGKLDKLRVVAKRRLGWMEPPTMVFFWPFKDMANEGRLTKGLFLREVQHMRNAEGANGDYEALIFAKALYEFENPGERRKRIKAEVKAKYKE